MPVDLYASLGAVRSSGVTHSNELAKTGHDQLAARRCLMKTGHLAGSRGGPSLYIIRRAEVDQRTAPSTFGCSSSFRLVTSASVVSMSPAIDAAFCNAERVTFVGSTIPAFTMST